MTKSSSEKTDWLAPFHEQVVIADLDHGLTIFGTLATYSDQHLELINADVHHQYEANSSRDIYALECRNIGLRPNRGKVSIPRHRILAIGLLDDVVG